MGTILVTVFQIVVILVLIGFVVMCSLASEGRFDRWDDRQEKKAKGKQFTD